MVVVLSIGREVRCRSAGAGTGPYRHNHTIDPERRVARGPKMRASIDVGSFPCLIWLVNGLARLGRRRRSVWWASNCLALASRSASRVLLPLLAIFHFHPVQVVLVAAPVDVDPGWLGLSPVPVPRDEVALATRARCAGGSEIWVRQR
jgi:hypothetical protein